MTLAVILQPSVLNATLPLWLVLLGIGLAAFGAVALLRWSELGDWMRSRGNKRLALAVCVALALASTRVQALIFYPYSPCTEAEWDQLLLTYTYLHALFIWYLVCA